MIGAFSGEAKYIDEKISEEAKEAIEKLLIMFNERDDWGDDTLEDMIDYILADFNDTVREDIKNSIYHELSANTTKSLAPITIPPALLSDNLYLNSRYVLKDVFGVLKDANTFRSTAGDVALQLYDGYDEEKTRRNKEILNAIYFMPDYIRDYLEDEIGVDEFMDRVGEIKTRDLQIALEGLVGQLNVIGNEALEKALDVAGAEKLRYFANRIAKTEIQRAKSLAQANDMLLDDDIQLVKWELSSAHKIFDICDFHATYDYGYGAGVYYKCDYPAIPLHPFCMCKVVPYYHDVVKKKVDNPIEDTMGAMTTDQQRKVIGSMDKLNDWYNGEPFYEILNKTRPKYPITKICKYINELWANESIPRDVRGLQREINAQIAEHGDLSELDYNMMNTSDRDLTRIQRLMNTLDQVVDDIEAVKNGDDIGYNPSLRDVLDYENYRDELLKYSRIKPTIDYENETITIWRSARGDIEAGDWIALTENYADGHNYDGLNDLYSKVVSWDDIRWQGADFNEWIYLPEWALEAYQEGELTFDLYTNAMSTYGTQMENLIGNWTSGHAKVMDDYYKGVDNPIAPLFELEEDNLNTIYRGLHFQRVDPVLVAKYDKFVALEVGDTYVDIAPTSWTTDPHIADGFSFAKNPAYYSVELKVVNPDDWLGYKVGDLSHFPTEKEVLIAPNEAFEVVGSELKVMETPNAKASAFGHLTVEDAFKLIIYLIPKD